MFQVFVSKLKICNESSGRNLYIVKNIICGSKSLGIKLDIDFSGILRIHIYFFIDFTISATMLDITLQY